MIKIKIKIGITNVIIILTFILINNLKLIFIELNYKCAIKKNLIIIFN